MSKVVAIVSGGMDSTTLLYYLKSYFATPVYPLGYTVEAAVSFDYGQKHSKELEFARETCDSIGIKHVLIDISDVGRHLESHLLGHNPENIPEGHYEEESMKVTVVPNRNMIMLSIAAGIAMSRKAGYVAYAAHSGDHTVYPDCREEFACAMETALRIADWHEVELLRPFILKSKADIVRIGDTLDIPWEKTWSCYKGGELHCGKCGTCVERREAFQLAGVPDPTVYREP